MTSDHRSAMGARLTALDNVMGLWHNHRLTEEPSVEDLVLLAGWVATGDLAPIFESTDRNAIRYPREVYATADPARWTPPADSTLEGANP